MKMLLIILSALLTNFISTAIAKADTPELNSLVEIMANDTSSNHQFGYDVALDGNTMVVATESGGSAYIFEKDASGIWSQTYKLEGVGKTCVDISGDLVVVGDEYNYKVLFIERQGDGSWDQTLTIHNPEGNETFGNAVCLDGENRVLIGNKNDNTSDNCNGCTQGSAYLYEKQKDGQWLLIENFIPYTDNSQSGMYMGFDVALSGDHVAVCGRSTNYPSIFTYQKLKDESWVGGALDTSDVPSSIAYCAVDISGDQLVLGSRYDDEGGNSAGAAFVCEFDAADGWVLVQKLMPNDPFNDNRFGTSVALQNDYLLVGSSNNTEQQRAGAAYIFEKSSDGLWSEAGKLISTSAGEGDQFGGSVALDWPNAIIGCKSFNVPQDSGRVFGFHIGRVITVNESAFIPEGIQQSIDAASEGYTTSVDIPSGTYNEFLIIDKSIDIQGIGDNPSDCVIDAAGLMSSVVTSQDASPTIQNLTITGGSSELGAGVHIIGGSPTINECDIYQNDGVLGGGIFAEENAILNIVNSTISNNWAVDGGGICAIGGRIEMSETVVDGNLSVEGGGIYTENCIVDISGTNITNNAAYSAGGSIFVESNVVLEYSWIGGNAATNDSGVLALGSFIEIDSCLFSTNFAENGSGAIGSQGSNTLVGNSGFCQNAPDDVTGTWIDLGGNEFTDCDEIDCNQNGLFDNIEISEGTVEDCNVNGVPDECDIASGFSFDVDGNDIPDECQVDCNENSVPDYWEIKIGDSEDCNENGVPDECDISSGVSQDCNTNNIPDECDLASGESADCNSNGMPDECDIANGIEEDCNTNGVPDQCDIQNGFDDLNNNGIPDDCDIANGSELDCNENGIIDSWEIDTGFAEDCNENGIPDQCDFETGVLNDCDGNGVPDECKFIDDPSLDCNSNGILDLCDIESGSSTDYNSDWIPDDCQCLANLDDNDSIDINDLLILIARWGNTGKPGMLADVNWDGVIDTGDLLYLIGSWGPCE